MDRLYTRNGIISDSPRGDQSTGGLSGPMIMTNLLQHRFTGMRGPSRCGRFCEGFLRPGVAHPDQVVHILTTEDQPSAIVRPWRNPAPAGSADPSAAPRRKEFIADQDKPMHADVERWNDLPGHQRVVITRDKHPAAAHLVQLRKGRVHSGDDTPASETGCCRPNTSAASRAAVRSPCVCAARPSWIWQIARSRPSSAAPVCCWRPTTISRP